MVFSLLITHDKSDWFTCFGSVANTAASSVAWPVRDRQLVLAISGCEVLQAVSQFVSRCTNFSLHPKSFQHMCRLCLIVQFW